MTEKQPTELEKINAQRAQDALDEIAPGVAEVKPFKGTVVISPTDGHTTEEVGEAARALVTNKSSH